MPNIYYEQEYDSTEKSKVYFNIYFNQQSKTKRNLERKRFYTFVRMFEQEVWIDLAS